MILIGYKIHTSNGVREVVKNGRTVLRVVNKGSLYFILTNPKINVVALSVYKSFVETLNWHTRLGHIGNKGLMKLHHSGLIDSKPDNVNFYETCILGKKTAHSFDKSSLKVSSPLEYAHSDLWGPARTPTIGGRSYFLSIITLEKHEPFYVG